MATPPRSGGPSAPPRTRDHLSPTAPMSSDDPDQLEHELLEAESAEELKARLEREHNELLQELRSLIPGANVLLGFLLAVSFTDRVRQPRSTERYVYFATLVSTAVALVLFMAPAAHHRLRFREGDKDHMLRKGNREAIAGTVASSLAFTGVLYLVTDADLRRARGGRSCRSRSSRSRRGAGGASRSSARCATEPPSLLARAATLSTRPRRNARTSPGPTMWMSSRRPFGAPLLGSRPPTWPATSPAGARRGGRDPCGRRRARARSASAPSRPGRGCARRRPCRRRARAPRRPDGPTRISAGAPARCWCRSFRSSRARHEPYSGSACR